MTHQSQLQSIDMRLGMLNYSVFDLALLWLSDAVNMNLKIEAGNGTGVNLYDSTQLSITTVQRSHDSHVTVT